MDVTTTTAIKAKGIKPKTAIRRPPSKKLPISSLNGIKKGIWLYFWLLIFEGALRKWVLPGLATPLLIIRDPVAIWILLKVWQSGQMPLSNYLTSIFLVGLLGTITAVLFGHGNVLVALYGARSFLIHFPLMFAIGRILTQEDVIKLGKTTLLLSIPLALLVVAQFYSPQSALVNRGVGGDMEGSGFSGALGYFRPSGPFSFTNGISLFYSFCASFIFYFWLNPKQCSKIILVIATAALFIVIPLSISRGLFFAVAISSIFALIAATRNPKYFSKIVLAGIGGVVTLLILSRTSFFQTGIEAFSSRFDAASDHEGGLQGSLINRYFGTYINDLISSSDQPIFGYGLGMGTNVGSMLLTGGRVFLIAEGEWGRLIGELGPLLGLYAIFIRVALSWRMLITAYDRLIHGRILPWMLLCFVLLNLPQGQWAPPTSLGFSTLAVGLLMASLKSEVKNLRR